MGRVIRSKTDYGIMILADQRYGRQVAYLHTHAHTHTHTYTFTHSYTHRLVCMHVCVCVCVCRLTPPTSVAGQALEAAGMDPAIHDGVAREPFN